MQSRTFAGAIDYAMLIKLYGESPREDRRRYNLTEFKGTTQGVVSGNPERFYISTSFVEASESDDAYAHASIYG